nr:MAG TPA: hypothetical protein [Caudoviricetes sp.]
MLFSFKPARTATVQPMGWEPIITCKGKPWQLL